MLVAAVAPPRPQYAASLVEEILRGPDRALPPSVDEALGVLERARSEHGAEIAR